MAKPKPDTSANRRSKRKPLGKLPPLSDADLDAMAQVTPQDIEAAKARWRADVKPKFKNLLDAEEGNAENQPPNA